MNYLRVLVVLNCIFFISPFAFSQALSGRIYDATYLSAIKNATIISYNNNDEIIDYKTSDINGDFEINITNISKIEFRKLNFEVFILTNFKNLKIEIKLQPKVKEELLDEVFIESKNYIRNSKDTLTFKADKLRDVQDSTLEDLIGKIPGIEINELTGEIKYLNTNIAKILLDGDDLTGNNYQLVSKNLGQKIANEIQVIEGYSDSKILKKFNRSQQTVINIKTENKYKKKLNGNINLGYGIKDVYKEQSNIFLLGKTKILSHVSFNNIGEISLGNISTNSSFNSSLQVTESSILKSISLRSITGSFQNIRLGSYLDLTQNKDLTISKNLLFSKKGGSTSKINLVYYNDLLSRGSNRSVFDLTNNGNNTVFAINKSEEKKPKNFLISNSNKFILNRNLELNLDLSFKNNKGIFTEDGVLNTNPFFEKTITDEKQFEASTRIIKKINHKNVLIAYSNFLFQKLKDNFRYNLEGTQFNSIFNLNLSSGQSTTNSLSFGNIFTENQIQYIYKPNNKNIVSSSINLSQIKVDANNDFSLTNPSNNVITQILSLTDFKIQTFSIDMNWSYFSNSIKLSSFVKLNFLNYNSEINKAIPTFSFLIDKRFGFNEFQFNYDKSINFSPYYYLFDTVYQYNNRNFFQGNSSINPYNISNTFSSKYNYNHIKSNFVIGVESNYSIIENPFLNSIIYNDNSAINSVISINNRESILNFNISLDKFLPKINNHIKFLPKYSQSNFINLVNSIEYNNKSENYKLEATARSAFDFRLNYHLGFTLNKSNYFTQSDSIKNKSSITSYSGFLNLNSDFLDKKLIISSKNVWVKQDEFSPNIFVSNINATYKLKNIQIECSINNIFNTKSIFERFQNTTTLIETENNIINRNINFQINYIF